MKKTGTISVLLTFVFFVAVVHPSYTKKNVSPSGNTGAPLETTCAKSQCHTGTALQAGTNVSFNIGVGTATLPLDPNFKYVPGETYAINVTINQSSANYGFQMTILDGQDLKAGDFAITDASNTQTTSSGGRDYMSHKNADATNSFDFSWTAPPAPIGPITFYCTSNAGNGQNDRFGDVIYRWNTTIDPAGPSTSAFEPKSVESLSIFPTVGDGSRVNVTFDVIEPIEVDLDLCNLYGQQIENFLQTSLSSGQHQYSFYPQHDLSPGVYLLILRTPEGQLSQKLVIQ